MKIIEVGGLPVVEGTAEELVKLATAAAGAVRHREAVVFHEGAAQIGVRLVEPVCDLEVCPKCKTTGEECPLSVDEGPCPYDVELPAAAFEGTETP